MLVSGPSILVRSTHSQLGNISLWLTLEENWSVAFVTDISAKNILAKKYQKTFWFYLPRCREAPNEAKHR